MIAVHFREYWLFGLLFAIVAPLQLAWALLVTRRPPGRPLLVAGAAGNVAVAAVWILSRTAGLPIGPHPGEPEPIGFKDVLATADELACALLVAVALARAGGAWLVVPAWVLAALSVIGAVLPGGHA